MKTTIKILLISCLLTSCTSFLDERHYSVQPELQPFVDTFYKEAAKRGYSFQPDYLSIYIDDLSKYEHDDISVHGVSSHKMGTVRIDKWFYEGNIGHSWNDKIDTLMVEYVMFHELGHFLLYREHDDVNYTIMNSMEWYESDYVNSDSLRTVLIDELFKR